MADELAQQVAQNAPALGTGGFLGTVVAIIGSLNIFAKKSDVDNVRLQASADLNAYKAEVAEKYITREALKESLQPMQENIHYIRECVDDMRKSGG
jgi:hypothetical protein